MFFYLFIYLFEKEFPIERVLYKEEYIPRWMCIINFVINNLPSFFIHVRVIKEERKSICNDI